MIVDIVLRLECEQPLFMTGDRERVDLGKVTVQEMVPPQILREAQAFIVQRLRELSVCLPLLDEDDR